jgi:hypothetical protein
MAIGKMISVDLRSLWKFEEQGFSCWLENNIDQLSAAIGFGLGEVQREQYVGPFQVDLTAEDNGGELVVIENQLEATDHDHLGKILMYFVNMQAKKAIWIASKPRPEHVKSVVWLNEVAPADNAFYLVQLSAYRINESDPAPLFTLVAGPTKEIKGMGERKKELAERHLMRLRFWESLLHLASAKGVKTHDSRSPSKEHWITAGAGRSGVGFNYLIWTSQKQVAVEVYIDTGDEAQNKIYFDQLYSEAGKIEAEFGDTLVWERLDEKQASRIRYVIMLDTVLRDSEDKWLDVQDKMIDAMHRLASTFRSRIEALPKTSGANLQAELCD